MSEYNRISPQQASRVRKAMKEAGTAQEIADRIGIQVAYVRRFIKQNPTEAKHVGFRASTSGPDSKVWRLR